MSRNKYYFQVMKPGGVFEGLLSDYNFSEASDTLRDSEDITARLRDESEILRVEADSISDARDKMRRFNDEYSRRCEENGGSFSRLSYSEIFN